MQVINKKMLYGNENAFVLYEYQRELKLLKQLINISEQAIAQCKVKDLWSYGGVCHAFAQTILDYSKAAYDNLVLGHFHAVNMISRSVLENLVCLDTIISYQEHELWKYYLAHSCYKSLCTSKRELDVSQREEVYGFCRRLDLPEEYYIRGKTKPYIECDYGWIYKINSAKKLSFRRLCEMYEDNAEYHGFRMMSEYSHGTSYFLKMDSSISVDHMMFMIINIYISIYRMVMIYLPDGIDTNFDNIAMELESIFYGHIQYQERWKR